MATNAPARVKKLINAVEDIVPESLHQRTPLMVGSRHEMEVLHRYAKQERQPR